MIGYVLLALLLLLLGYRIRKGRAPQPKKKTSPLTCLLALGLLFVGWLVLVMVGGRMYGQDARVDPKLDRNP